ncbi:helix-hairpin-helix domain-containing protein [Alkalihalobacillus sp. MEB130]|uniref:helix-hairpin-helix domain-containing protein n=1 Tax=Alkalihalobacillus sp. MEB130 TaxID=2976704 RepID=UPI0028DE9FE6|nr:helix-hairpin-helix domain-containing protein [Alkalihalobacillus sp. MEB130]MDT8861432.1 helix-hairpin-helix domain-containing protein [Alkalihalobacillus sp. MEB130]
MIKKMLERKQILSTAAILLLVSVVLFLLFSNPKEEEVTFNWTDYQQDMGQEANKQELHVSEMYVTVDVKGSIQNPGVYELRAGERIHDVIKKAGGFLPDADERKLNLAQLLHDEMMIYVPKMGEEEAISENMTSPGEAEGKIRINHADASTLEQLPGIGPAKAAAIVAHREEHGPFKTEADLLQVSGIGPKSVENLKEHLTFH